MIQNNSENKTVLKLVNFISITLIFILLTRTTIDADLWWHLRAGQMMVEQKQILLTDIFSYTRFGAEWVNAFWISEILLYAIYSIGGYFGLTFFVAITGVATFYLISRRLSGNPFLNGFILILAAITAAPIWGPRPQILSFFIIALLDDWLINKRPRWFLIPLFAIWSNIHGGWIWGFLLLIAHSAGEFIEQLISQEKNWSEIKNLIGWSALSALAIGLNPNGLAIWVLPFQQINVSLQIQEWLSPDFHQIAFHPLLWMIFLLLLSASFSKKQNWSQLFKTLGFAYLTFFSQRNIALFAIVAVPLLFDWMNATLQNFQRDTRLKPTVDLPRPLRLLINSTLVFALVVTALGNTYLVSQPEKVDSNYPIRAIEWIKENQPQGNLFNSYNWGGYLLWTLPEYPVFIDGRADLYGNEIINQWHAVVSGNENAIQILDEWQVNLILIEPYWEITKTLELNGWQKVFEDEQAVIFVR
ncbi:MAG: hypothetical protein JNM46_01445 [Anaerolineales bacterium]|nr:hypothetical protein [Anaerolineales bacterium]